MRTRLTDQFGLDLPLIQAPMAGVSTPSLAAAASRAGALGSIAVGAASDAAAERAIGEAMAGCPGPLNVNVFTHPPPRRDADRERAWLARLAPAFAEFGAEPPAGLDEIYPTFDARPGLLEALVALRPAVVSFHFGVPRARAVRALKDAGVMLLLTVTSLAETRRAEAAGMDAVVAQGWEAGGHRGAFESGVDQRLGTHALLAALRGRVGVPVIAAGGVTDGRAVAAALAAGADGVQLGSVFIACPESAAGAAHRAAMAQRPWQTVMTPAFSGRPARGIRNRFTDGFDPAAAAVPDYPLAYDAAKRLAAAAAAAGRHDFDAMWAGANPVPITDLGAEALIARLAAEAEAEAAGG